MLAGEATKPREHVSALGKSKALFVAVTGGWSLPPGAGVNVSGVNAPVADTFTEAGWKRRPLGTYWTLVTAPRAADGICRRG